MQAVIFTQDRTFELTERPVPDVSPGEVLLEVELCGICGTDLHAAELEGLFAPPVVVGHEFTASVAAVGPRVDRVQVGQRVVVNPIARVCGTCGPCRAGLANQCVDALSKDCCGVGRDGGMAEYVALDAVYATPLPDGLPAAVGAWTEPLAVAVRGVRRGQVRVGDTVAILGAGPIGQLTLQAARAAGGRSILVVESSSMRRQTALACGASDIAHPDDLDGVDRLYDVVFDCTGAPAAVDAALRLVSYDGRVVVIGTYAGENPLHERMAAHMKEANITFSLCYGPSPEFEAAIDLLARGVVDVAPLTTRVAPIDEHAEAFAEMRNAETSIKVLIAPSAQPGL
jgi:2-desacetyl-2-hydroxyethyl bacteriochlorophyllide A dehydrogenase